MTESPADLLDQPVPFAFTDARTGRVWNFLLSGRIVAHEIELENYLKDKAYRVVQQFANVMSAQEYQLALAAWMNQCVCGKYAFGGLLCHEFLTTREGFIEDAWLHARVRTPDVTRDVLHQVAMDPRKSQELLQTIAWVNDPNRDALRRPGEKQGPTVVPGPSPKISSPSISLPA